MSNAEERLNEAIEELRGLIKVLAAQGPRSRSKKITALEAVKGYINNQAGVAFTMQELHNAATLLDSEITRTDVGKASRTLGARWSGRKTEDGKIVKVLVFPK